MKQIIRKTRSVCPVCLKNLPADLVQEEDGRIFLEKCCPDHGHYSVPVWQGQVDFDKWLLGHATLQEGMGVGCPGNCGICSEHEAGSCCVLLEVTERCNLHCKFCFADGGKAVEDPAIEEMKEAIKEIAENCGGPLIQFSGGEPTLRDDLPELVRYAKEAGCSYVQVNTNGIRLAEDPDYAKELAEAGLDIVFLQFDGTKNEIFEALRGKPLLETKLKAIQVCGDLKLGVTLVPTVVKGVNTDNLGDLVQLAAKLAPAVRGIHFQPVSYFGRIPGAPEAEERYTLDQLMADISSQAGIPMETFMPSRCDHPLCGFHGNYMIRENGPFKPLTSIAHSSPQRCCCTDNREYVARHWSRPEEEQAPKAALSDEMDFDTFLYYLRHRSLALSAMAFQDAMNLNIERLHTCSLHVYDHGKIKPFCAKYLTPIQ